MAAVVTATAARLIWVGREAAGHRQAATGPQGARKRPVAEGDDAALQLPHRPAVEPALAEREPDSDAEVVEEPRHILAGNGVGTNPLNVLEQGEGLLDLGLHVELLRPHGQAGRDFRKRVLPLGQFNAKITQRGVQHGPHVVILGFQNPSRRELDLSAELLHLPSDLGMHYLFGCLRLAARRLSPGHDRGAELFGPAGPLHAGYDRP